MAATDDERTSPERRGANPRAVGITRNVRFDPDRGVVGDVEVSDPWVCRLLDALEAEGLSHLVGLAPILDIAVRRGEASIVRCHGVALVTSSAVGGRFGDGPRVERERTALDRVVGLIGPKPREVHLVVDPIECGPTDNGDGTFRVIEAEPPTPGSPSPLERVRRFAATRAEAPEAERSPLVVGTRDMARACEIEAALGCWNGETPSEAERDGQRLHGLGVDGAPSARVAGNRAAGRARSSAKRNPAPVAEAELERCAARRGLTALSANARADVASATDAAIARETEAVEEARRLRAQVAMVELNRELSRAGLAALEYRLSGQLSRSDVARRFGVTSEQLRWAGREGGELDQAIARRRRA